MVDVALIPGDGIGREIMPGVAAAISSISDINFVTFDISSERYIKTGIIIKDDELEELKNYRAILFGAIGDPRVRPGIMEQGVILRLRRELELYMNIRPVRSFDDKIKITILRENTQDFYTDISGIIPGKRSFNVNGTRIEIDGSSCDEVYYTMGMLSYRYLKKFFNKAFSICDSTVTVTDKANAVKMYNLWRSTAMEAAIEKNINISFEYADALAYNMILNPKKYRYIIAPNLYGDIISDMGAALVGGLGYAPSANIGDKNALFEPVHGSAPDIAGRDMANPAASIMAGSMLLEYLGYRDESRIINDMVRNLYINGVFNSERTSKIIERFMTITK
ncbi:isocitrate/isopropylmalate family dehydrogenase [Picrophilus oshimae]|uniref:3-isopropylmalate dehydrogenase n=1 Tax=Picrophilus torridus (strain ATCC 700027 / DSM 9790 / JCM 10055 / NBRC 100828 / KAW 2/3) TaxID=1122961 RepID=Q6L0K7_PICTO|nr:isocitrate/isopropylmalate family dehydrogenase [Picrophilus oshimae]AAT43495.1 3-isopropylmalate dehydrogenase [Picrophilus oshimae DSM 9789]